MPDIGEVFPAPVRTIISDVLAAVNMVGTKLYST